MFQTPFFKATAQEWKLRVLYVLLGAMIVLVVVRVMGIGHFGREHGDLLLLSAIFVTVLGLGWMGLAFRCPDCAEQIGWWYLRHKSVTEWFTEFVQTKRCPNCGYEGERGVK
jgi:predicted RNA-binding Zn-ribbon protein involved in translation (DUF1610 family)